MKGLKTVKLFTQKQDIKEVSLILCKCVNFLFDQYLFKINHVITIFVASTWNDEL